MLLINLQLISNELTLSNHTNLIRLLVCRYNNDYPTNIHHVMVHLIKPELNIQQHEQHEQHGRKGNPTLGHTEDVHNGPTMISQLRLSLGHDRRKSSTLHSTSLKNSSIHLLIDQLNE